MTNYHHYLMLNDKKEKIIIIIIYFTLLHNNKHAHTHTSCDDVRVMRKKFFFCFLTSLKWKVFQLLSNQPANERWKFFFFFFWWIQLTFDYVWFFLFFPLLLLLHKPIWTPTLFFPIFIICHRSSSVVEAIISLSHALFFANIT